MRTDSDGNMHELTDWSTEKFKRLTPEEPRWPMITQEQSDWIWGRGKYDGAEKSDMPGPPTPSISVIERFEESKYAWGD